MYNLNYTHSSTIYNFSNPSALVAITTKQLIKIKSYTLISCVKHIVIPIMSSSPRQETGNV